MKVHELVAILQNADQNADVRVFAGFNDADLEAKHIDVADGLVSIDLNDFVGMVEDYCEMLGAL
jgi:hypothetical protein